MLQLYKTNETQRPLLEPHNTPYLHSHILYETIFHIARITVPTNFVKVIKLFVRLKMKQNYAGQTESFIRTGSYR